MVIEDDLRLLNLYAEALISSGHSVSCFSDPVQAVRNFNKSYDLVIVDHFLPQKNGVEVINDIKSVKPEQEVFLISGALDEVQIPESLKIKKFGKPFSLIDLNEMISQMQVQEKIP